MQDGSFLREREIGMNWKEMFAKVNLKEFFNIKSIFFILLGNAMYSVAVAAFIIPNGLITGGTTGLSIFAHNQLGIPISAFVAGFNVLMFVLGLIFLGLNFALSTLLSTIIYPVFLEIFQNIPALQNMTEDPLLAVIMAGLMVGAGLGLVVRVGGSTGGMDIPPLILNKYFRIPVSVSLNVFDILILLPQILYNPPERVLYGILLVMIYTTVLDKVLVMGNTKTEVKIISKQVEEVRQAILAQVDRGVTMLYGEGGYKQEQKQIVLSIVSNRELPQVEKLIRQIDPEAFMIISRVTEVRGRGFSLSKHYGEEEG